MRCPACGREFKGEEELKGHVEECRAVEQIKKEGEFDYKFNSSGCLF